MKKIFLSAAVLAMFAAGCQNDVLVQQESNEGGQLMTLVVNRGVESRTHLGTTDATTGKTPTYWSEGDKIYVSGKSGKVTGVLKLKDGMNSAEGTFEGYIFGGKIDDLQHLVFPAPVDGKIDMAARKPGKLDAPMIGTIVDGAVHTLNNVGGILAITDDAKTKKIIATDKEKNMTGGYYEFKNGELIYTPVDNPAPVYDSGDLLMVPVATQTIAHGNNSATSAINVTALDQNDDIISASTKSITITEGQIMGDSPEEKVMIEMKGTEVGTLESLKEVLASGGYIKLIEDIKSSEIITISSNVVLDGNGKTLTYTGSDRAITVDNTVASADVSINDLIVDCSNSYCQRGINFNTTGKLNLNKVKVSGKNVTYALNLPSSSDNAQVSITNSTLIANIALNIWGENIVINVEKSYLESIDNSAVEDYAAIVFNNDGTNIARGGKITITGGSIIAKNQNGEPNKTLTDNTKTAIVSISDETTIIGSINHTAVAIISYENTDQFYSCFTLQSAIEQVAADNKGIIKILEDINLTEQLTIPANESITIDLNGYKIELNGNKITIGEGGTLTINNGEQSKVYNTGEITTW